MMMTLTMVMGVRQSYPIIQLYSPFGRINIKYKHSQTRIHNKTHTEHTEKETHQTTDKIGVRYGKIPITA